MTLPVRDKAEDVKARELLAQSAPGADPALSGFFDALYQNASPEDVTRYAQQELAELARLVFARAAARGPDETLVALFDPKLESGVYAHNDTVLVAVNNDAPFLFDSPMAEVNMHGARLRAVFHPIVMMGGRKTSVIVLVLDAVIGEERRAALVRGAEAAFAQVAVAVRDWHAMQQRLGEAVAELRAHPSSASADELEESVEFLEWLGDNHFTFLGCRDYIYFDEGEGRLEPVGGSGLGVLADRDARVVRRARRHRPVDGGGARLPHPTDAAHHHEIERAKPSSIAACTWIISA